MPPPNSRVAFIGPTGCGKTVLATKILQHYKHVIVIDPKHQFEFEKPRLNERIARDWSQFLKFLNKSAKDGLPVIWRPPKDLQDQESLDRVYGVAFDRGNTLVYCDELYFLTNGSSFGTHTPNYRNCVTAGRSKGVGTWSAFQRPAWIPIIALSETEIRYIFYLQMANDRKRVDEIVVGAVDWEGIRPKTVVVDGKTVESKYKFIISTTQATSSPMRLNIGVKPSHESSST